MVYIKPLFLENIKNSSRFQRNKFQKFNPLIKLNAMGEFSGYSNFQQNLSDIVQFQQH